MRCRQLIHKIHLNQFNQDQNKSRLGGKNMEFYQFKKKKFISFQNDKWSLQVAITFMIRHCYFQSAIYFFNWNCLHIYACSIKSRTLNFNRNFHAHKLNDHFTIDKFGIATFDWHNSRPHKSIFSRRKKWSINAS